MSILISAVAPVIASPIIGAIVGSLIETLIELREYGEEFYEPYVFLGGSFAVVLFPILYAVILSSDAIVSETELGTMELLWWAPLSEVELIAAKSVIPAALSTVMGLANLATYVAVYTAMSPTRFLWEETVGSAIFVVCVVPTAVNVGIIISSHATSTKAAGGLSMIYGGLLLVTELIIGASLMAVRISPLISLLALSGLTLAVGARAFTVVAKKIGRRESYFIVRRG